MEEINETRLMKKVIEALWMNETYLRKRIMRVGVEGRASTRK